MRQNFRTFYRKIIFSLLPLILLLFAGEVICRLKYVVDHKDIHWLFIPFYSPHLNDQFIAKPPKTILIGGQEVTLVYSPCQGKELIRSYNEYGWRSPSFSKSKPEGLYRILVVGGSTVLSYFNGDIDTWVYRLGELLKSEKDLAGRVEVINAGVSSYNTRIIGELLLEKGFGIKPDMIVYYEAINELRLLTPTVGQLENRIALLGKSSIGLVHRILYFRSMLYTYLVEKYFYSKMKVNQWRIDENLTRKYLLSIIENCQERSIDFVYVRQVIDFPMEKGGKILTDKNEIRDLLKVDYAKDLKKEPKPKLSKMWEEIRALDQRLINEIQTDICLNKGLLVIDPLPVFDAARKDSLNLFIDICHTTCLGDSILAECVYQGLRAKVKEKVLYNSKM